MLKNYLLVAYRNLYKNKVSSLVNIVGLSVAIGIVITTFLFVEGHYTRDRFHENGENIFLIESEIAIGDARQLRGDSPSPLGPALVRDFPQVKRAVRVSYGSPTFQANGNTFQERIWFVDPDFQDVFSFTLRLGDKSAPIKHEDIILSDEMATKYFGDANPMGEDLVLIFGDDERRSFTVTGVAEPFPLKASFDFNALIHYDHQIVYGWDVTDWADFTGATFIEVGSPSDIDEISDQVEGYRQQQNAANQNRPVSRFVFDNLRNLSVNSQAVSGDISGGNHPAAVIVLGLVALFMLALSCINYMNLAVATASRRLKEIGIRKSVGSKKSQIVAQFLSENVLLCLLAMVLGLGLAYALFIPGFNNLMGDDLAFANAETGTLWTFLVVLLLVTGTVSGAYPALYISSFKPSVIFRGSTDLGGENWFTRGFLTFQFVLAFLTMIMGVVLAQNAEYQANKDWGYESDHMVVVRTSSGEQYSALKSEIQQLSGVGQIVGARNHLARSWSFPTVDIEGEKLGTARFDVGEGFLEMFEIPLLSGSGFDSASKTETDGQILINRRFAEVKGWSAEEAIGKRLSQDSLRYAVGGVLEDFMYDTIYDPLEPAFLRSVGIDDYRFMTIKVAAGSGVQTEEAIQEIWKRMYPEQEYNGFFQDAVFDAIMSENTNIKTLFSFIAGLALIIACMGLFGLAAQKVVRRMKEISIRKVLGASVPHLTRKMNMGFLYVLVAAALLASPMGYFAMSFLLQSVWADPMPVGPSAFILSFTFVLLTAALTVSTQIRKFVTANPAEVLRNQ